MTPDLFLSIAIEPALGLLPPLMDTHDARAMIVAICLQETRLLHRRQFGGPARGYPQFELTGINGVLTHHSTAPRAREVCVALDVAPTAPSVYLAIEFQDVLACAFARLLLWTLPRRLPTRQESAGGFEMYLEAWRPGRPRPEFWSGNFMNAWTAVELSGETLHG